MPSFQDVRDGLDSLLKDAKGVLTPDEKDGHIKNAVRALQRKFPRIVAQTVSGNGGFQYDLPATFVDGFSAIVALYYPYAETDQDPDKLERADYKLWDGPNGTKLRFKEDTPQATESFLLVFTAPHTAGEPADEVATLDAAGTVINADGQTSAANADLSEATAARLLLHVTALDADASFTAEVQISDDQGQTWASVAITDPITAVGEVILPIKKERVGAYMRVVYHPVGGTATLEAEFSYGTLGTMTVPDHLQDLLCYLAGNLCALSLASYYSHLSDSALPNDTIDYEGKSQYWRDQAEKWKAEAEAAMAAAPKPRRLSGTKQGDWDLTMSDGGSMLTHHKRLR